MKPFTDRTKAFAIAAVKLYTQLPSKPEITLMGKQLMRSATSVGANYRAACRAQSRAGFIAKLSIVEEEADECIYWMELLSEFAPELRSPLEQLMAEANELVAITVSSKKTARHNS